MTKEQLRYELTLLKQGLPAEQIEQQSKAVVRLVDQWPKYRAARRILFYCPVKREVQIQNLMAKAIGQGKSVYAPVCDIKSGTMKPAEVQSMNELSKGPYGILEPKSSPNRLARRRTLDILLVPGLGFDKKGNRLGRGKGYYDKFLRRWAGKGMKVGIAFRQQVIPAVPVGPTDVSMDYIAYPGGIVRCRKRGKK